MGVAIAALLYGGIARQDAAADTSADVLGEIVITARKRAENLQDVPQNIDVLTRSDLQNLALAQVEDYLALVPSISYISVGPGQQRFFIRGASDGSNPNFGSTNISTTGYLVDDLSLSFYGHIPDLHLYDVERIEVLNGPQRTLFGPDALSGAVRVVTRKPDPNAFSAGIDFDGGQIDGGANNWTYEGFINVPLIEGKTALRLSAYDEQQGGYIDNVLATRHWLNGVTSTNAAWAGNNFNTRDVIGTRIALQENFSADWKATLTGSYQRQIFVGAWEEDPGRFGPLNEERFAPQSGYDYDRYLDLHVDGDVGIGDLIYAGGYSDQQRRRVYDFSEYAQYSGYAGFVQASACAADAVHGSGYSGCNVPTMFGVVTGTIQRWSNELRLQSKGGGRAHWTVGAYWEKTADPYSGFEALPGIKLSGETAQYYISSYHHLAKPLAQELYSDYATFDYLETTEFGDLTFDLDNHWSIEGGAEHFHSNTAELTDWAGYYYQPKIPVLRTASAQKTNFKAGLNYKPADNWLLYFSFAQGFRDGSFNYVGAYAPAAIPRYFNPDTLDNYELGWKAELQNGRLVWNNAVYYMPWKNYQVDVLISGPPYSFHANIGDARIYGVESSVSLRPLTGLQLSLSGNYNDSILESNAWQNPAYVVTPGERLPESPYLNWNASIRYERTLGSGQRPYAQFTVAHKGDMWNDLRVDTRTLQPAYSIGDLRLGLVQAQGHWQAEAYISNLWNTRAIIFANYAAYTPPDRPDVPNEPRVFGLRLKYRWGKAD